jgi:hypothetical protein
MLEALHVMAMQSHLFLVVLQEMGGGHHSPLAAYHEASDSVLVLDVSR